MKALNARLIIFIFVCLVSACQENIPVPVPEQPEPLTKNDIIQTENQALSTVIPTNEISTFLKGSIQDEHGNPLEGVTVIYDDTSTITDVNGRFLFGNITVNEQYALIKANKQGYFTGFRTFAPTLDAINTISIQLLEKPAAKNFLASSGGTLIIDNEVALNFPENIIITENGEPYTDNVNVQGRYLSPTAENLSQIMPGTLVGLNEDNQLQALISYGMLNVELTDDSGNPLEIAKNQQVQIKLPAEDNAPSTIPLWHFNETYGVWVEAGIATKTADHYIGNVTHFSTWNLDLPIDGVNANITLVDQNGNPISNQAVEIYSSENRFLNTIFTDDNGKFRLVSVPENLAFKIKILNCERIEIPVNISSGELTVSADFSNIQLRTYILEGQFSDCQEDGTETFYNNTYFTINEVNNPNELAFAGVTDETGNFQISTTLCSVDETTSYNLTASLFLSNTELKDSILSIIFQGNSQTLDINYCNIEEEEVPDTIPHNFPIPFVDSNFEQGVRDAINKPTGTIVYEDVRYIYELVLSELSITDISGIEYFEHLVLLSFYKNSITDSSPLRNLKYLDYLELSYNEITDISFLADMPYLPVMDLSHNNISDISIFSGYSTLPNLYLNHNNISDISAFKKLENIDYLILNNNNIEDISPLIGLQEIDVLNLKDNNISEVFVFCSWDTSGKTYDTELNLSNNPLDQSDIDLVRSCLPDATLTF